MSTPVIGSLSVTPLYTAPGDRLVWWDGAEWMELEVSAGPAPSSGGGISAGGGASITAGGAVVTPGVLLARIVELEARLAALEASG